MQVNEIKIPVPWGFISAKCWGDPKDETLLALPGFKDNANTFDRLIPLLPKSFYYVCADLPGHGKSSPNPTVIIPTYLDYVLSTKLILDHLGKKKYILMGHSFGGRTETFFTQMYPEYVSKLIMLDSTYYIPIEPERCIMYYREAFEEYEKQIKMKVSESTPPTYGFEEAVQRMRDSRYSELSENSAKILMQRSLIPTEDGRFKISTAQNLKYLAKLPLDYHYMIKLLELHPITCPHLLVMGSDGEGDFNKKIIDRFLKNKKCEFHIVKGEHDVHLDHPERVAPIVSKFLLNQGSKL